MQKKPVGKPIKLSFKIVKQKDQPGHPAFGWKLSEKAKREIAATERRLIKG